MLANDEKKKIESYIDKLINNIYLDIKKSEKNGVTGKNLVDKTVKTAVNKLTPESKMLLSSTYNMLMETTLKQPRFQNAENQSIFYELNILKELTSKFTFYVPKDISYEEAGATITKLEACGAVVVTGAVVSVVTKNIVPVGIAAIIAGVMVFVLKNEYNVMLPGKNNNESTLNLIEEYLGGVKKSLLSWVTEIEKYYDEKISTISGRLVD